MDKSKQFELASVIEKCPTFSEILNYTAEKKPGRSFLVVGDLSWSYADFNGLVNQCCRYFQDLGFKPGDIISIILRNSVDYLILYLSLIHI